MLKDEIPPKKEILASISFSDWERQIYSDVERIARCVFKGVRKMMTSLSFSSQKSVADPLNGTYFTPRCRCSLVVERTMLCHTIR